MKYKIITVIAMLLILAQPSGLFSAGLGAGASSSGVKHLAMKLPEYEEAVLDNGLRIFIIETEEVSLVSFRLLIPNGSAAEPAGQGGLASITASLCMKGAAGMSAEEISEAVEGIGGELDVGATHDYTVFTGSFISRDLSAGLDLLAKVVLSPDFSEDEIEREKRIVEASIQGIKEDPYDLASREFHRILGCGHPYGEPQDGTLESVSGITRKEVKKFYVRNYRPNGAIMAIVGDVNTERALRAVMKSFEGWERGPEGAAKVESLEMGRCPGRKVVVIDKPGATQSQIRIGNISAGRNTPDFFPLVVANGVLGGGFTSRLMDEIRVNRGLSYGARSRLSQYRSGGFFGVVTFTKNETLRETIDVAFAELEKIRDTEVGEEELRKSEKYISGLFPFELETNSDLARWMTNLAFYGLTPDFIEGYRERVSVVSSEDVQRVARKYFWVEDCRILVLTDYEKTKDQIEGLGPVTVVKVDEVE